MRIAKMLLKKKNIKMTSCPADIRIFYKVGSGREMANGPVDNRIEQRECRKGSIYTCEKRI